MRVDVNGKWKLSEAIANLNKLTFLNLEYAEQPVNSLKNFKILKVKSKIPLAADESIRNISDAEIFIKEKGAEILILKPMMIGGIIPTIKIIGLAEKNNIKTVITSSLESAVGKAMAVFAASLVRSEIAHGLGTGAFFVQDFTPDPYIVKRGKISLHN
jgi:L-alanine-DL-glutamate epimerase-like enolase superfamily enzyme